MPAELKNPEFVEYRGQQVRLDELLDDYRDLRHKLAQSKSENRSAVIRRRQEKSLKPYQAELIRMQKYLIGAGPVECLAMRTFSSPSVTSSSEMPDSWNRSINFLSLRRSIVFPLIVSGGAPAGGPPNVWFGRGWCGDGRVRIRGRRRCADSGGRRRPGRVRCRRVGRIETLRRLAGRAQGSAYDLRTWLSERGLCTS